MEGRTCLICTVPISVREFGVEACRSCAAFFKRTVLAGRNYVCRQSDRKCVFKKHEKFMCRSCRYDQCVVAGMKYCLPRRKPPTKKVKEITGGGPLGAPSPSSPPVIADNWQDLGVTMYSEPLSSDSSLRLTEQGRIAPRDSLISRMEAEFKSSYRRRLVLEQEYVTQSNLKHRMVNSDKLYIAKNETFFELFRIAIKDSTTLLRNVFDDFDHLPIDNRVTLFKNYCLKFAMIECAYFTSKYFETSTMFMASLITCADINDMDQWMADNDNIVRKGAFRTASKGYTSQYEYLLKSMLKMGTLTEREFYALAVLCYCDVDTSLYLPNEIIENTARTRAIVLEELQDFYRNDLKVNDFSQRIGNLMTLVHCARESAILMNEGMRMYATIFDLYSDDRFFREFFAE